MRKTLVALVGWLLWTSPTVFAVTLTLAPSDALRCMSPPEAERVALEYPKEAFERKEGGAVDVELTFTASGSAPRVDITNEPIRSLADAVRRHVRQYRVPCLVVGQTATLKQSFLFTPTDGRQVTWTRPQDTGDGPRSELLRCIANARSKFPGYPMSALWLDEQGTVVLGLTYKDTGSPPDIEVLDDTPYSTLIDLAKEHAAGFRMPCHTGVPLRTVAEYIFRIEGGDRVVVKDMSLTSYLRGVKEIQIRSANVYFDFGAMKCPFDVRIRMSQPVSDNQVGEVGEAVPERRFFLDWLSRQRLNLDKKTQNRVYGQMTTVSIPCGVLSLGNVAGGGAGQ